MQSRHLQKIRDLQEELEIKNQALDVKLKEVQRQSRHIGKIEKLNARFYVELLDRKKYINLIDKENLILKSRIDDFLKLLKVKKFICTTCGSDLAQDGGIQGFNFDFFDIPSRQKLMAKIENDEEDKRARAK